MLVDKLEHPIRCTTLASPSRDSAYQSITLAKDMELPNGGTIPAGTTLRFDLTFPQIKLFAIQAAEMVANWPIESAAKTA